MGLMLLTLALKDGWRDSVTALQHFLGRPTWEELVDKRQADFKDRIAKNAGHILPNALFRYLSVV